MPVEFCCQPVSFSYTVLSKSPGPTPDELYGRYDPSLLYPSSDADEAEHQVAFLRGVHPKKTTVVTMELCLGSATKCVGEIFVTVGDDGVPSRT